MKFNFQTDNRVPLFGVGLCALGVLLLALKFSPEPEVERTPPSATCKCIQQDTVRVWMDQEGRVFFGAKNCKGDSFLQWEMSPTRQKGAGTPVDYEDKVSTVRF